MTLHLPFWFFQTLPADVQLHLKTIRHNKTGIVVEVDQETGARWQQQIQAKRNEFEHDNGLK